MHAIHPAQSQYHVHSRPPPPSNSTSSSSSRPPPTQQTQQNSREPVTVLAVPSVTVEFNQLIVGDARTCQFIIPSTPLSTSILFTFLLSFSPLSINTLLHSSQGRRRWIVWNRLVVRLAWDLTPQYTLLRHAVRSRCSSGVRHQATRSRQENEETMGRRLGRVQKTQRTRSPSVFFQPHPFTPSNFSPPPIKLQSLRNIPYHPNIIPLYDFFLLPSSKELYFVFESMEGNLYQLIKSRKGRPLAGGLVSSIFRQTVSGLYHIHASGYFHRDMKPENLLVTTTGLYDYRPVSPLAPPNAPSEKDVVVIIKLADFGLARETKSKPPYTEYVSTRWYRAPEVLLRSRDYSNPVDLWALGTIMAELVNLRPLFPGQGEIDQVARVCELLGDPSDEYGLDSRGKSFGGGRWPRGIKMAKAVGFAFPKVSSSSLFKPLFLRPIDQLCQVQPKDVHALFDRSVPVKLVECIADLLKYDPDARLTARQCLDHPYLVETTPKNNPPIPISSPPPLQSRPFPRAAQQPPAPTTQTPRAVPPSHAHSPSVPKPSPQFEPSATHRAPFYPSNGHRKDPDATVANVHVPSDTPPNYTASGYVNNCWDPMDVTSPEYETTQPMDIQTSPVAQEYPNRPPPDPEPLQDPANPRPSDAQANGPKLKTFGSLVSLKWGLGKFANADKVHQLPPVEENITSSNSTPSLKRSSSADSRSIEISPSQELDPKKRKKEAERMAKEAEKQKRALVEKMHREQARAVIRKRTAMQAAGSNLEWKYIAATATNPSEQSEDKASRNTTGPERRTHGTHERSTTTLTAAGGRYGEAPFSGWRGDERNSRFRRRDWDDDHSVSSSDLGRMSVISFATVDSDPGPMRLRSRSSAFELHKSSTSSLRAAYEELTKSARSSNSLSYEQRLLNDFHLRPSVDAGSSFSDHGSPPPMQNLKIGSPQWSSQVQPMTSWSDGDGLSDRRPHLSPLVPSPPLPPYAQGNLHSPTLSPYPSSPGLPKSAVNPMFKVVRLTTSITYRRWANLFTFSGPLQETTFQQEQHQRPYRRLPNWKPWLRVNTDRYPRCHSSVPTTPRFTHVMKVDDDDPLAKRRSSVRSLFSTAFFRISPLPAIRSFFSASPFFFFPRDALWTRILVNLVRYRLESGFYFISPSLFNHQISPPPQFLAPSPQVLLLDLWRICS